MNESRDDNVVIDVLENDHTWIYKLKKRLADTIFSMGEATTATNSNDDNNCSIGKPSIYRIPTCIRKVDPVAYEPQVLSLGPYHHGKPQLRAMDEHKWCYLRRFLRRNPEKDLNNYLQLVKDLESQARGAYSELESLVDSKDFIQMMLLDCGFVLEFLLINKKKGGEEEKKEEEHESIDPIGSAAWALPNVMRDMFLLENQLPFFLLEKLLQLNIPQQTPSLSQIIVGMFSTLMPGKIRETLTNKNGVVVGPIHHIPHLMYTLIIPTPEDDTQSPAQKCIPCSNPGDKPKINWIPCAKQLREAGVVFKKEDHKEDHKTFLDVTFERGVMKIPPLEIFGCIDSVFRNLIAFEQCHTPNDACLYISAYAYLMNLVIDTPTDVQLLKQEGIIVSTLGSDEDVAILFNQLRKNTAIDDKGDLAKVFKDITSHCEKKMNKWKASLNHNYFSNPWAIISVAAAIFLFVLTIMQTILAFFSYFRPIAA